MLTLVFSDSHGDDYTMECIIEKLRPDLVLFLGDGINDILDLELKFRNTVFKYVSGNCDVDSMEHNKKIVSIGAIKAFITHGNIYGNGLDIEAMRAEVEGHKVKIIMSGHTHTPTMSISDGIVYMNPGTIRRTLYDGSFGIIESNGEEFKCQIMFTKKFID